ncbi:MAG: hypothetical protein ACXVLM_06495 [Ilumatobacteraceae bacterium]
MSEFHDPELRQQLGRLSGPYPDDNAAFAVWQRRVGQVRRRRAMAWTTGAAMSLIVGVVGVAALQGRQTHSNVSQKSVESTSSVSTSVDDSRDKSVTTVSTAPPTTSVSIALMPDTTPTADGTVETAVIAPIATDPTATTPETSTHEGQGAPSTTTAKKAKTTTTTQSTQPSAPTTDGNDSHNATQKIDSVGGSITVRQDKDQLTVIDVTPSSGFQAHQSGHYGNEVFVTFTSSSHESDISVFVYHGKIIPKVSEQTHVHGQSVPTTEPSGGGGD